jgi:hypothetical protein
MKSILKITAIIFLVCSFHPTQAQEQTKATTQTGGIHPEESPSQKAQNNNTVKSNRTEGKAAIDQSNSGATQNDNSNAATSKKGYEYYKAQSDLNSAKSATSTTKAQDHNSSRSNKTASPIDKGNNSGADEKRVNKVESINIK